MWRNLFWITSISPITLVLISSCQNQENIKNENNLDEFENITSDDIFPKIDEINYYQYVEFENHIPVITKKLKTNFIKDVLTRISTTKGNISYYIKDFSKQESVFYFNWKFKEISLFKTYSINLKINPANY